MDISKPGALDKSPPTLPLQDIYQQGMAAIRAKDKERADSRLTDLLSNGASASDVRVGLLRAEILMLEGQGKAAETVLQQTWDANARDFWLPLRLARLRSDQGDFDAAFTLLDQAELLETTGRIRQLRMFRAELCLKSGRKLEAALCLNGMIETYPNEPWAYQILSGAAESEGSLTLARSLLKQLLDQGIARVGVVINYARLAAADGAQEDAISELQAYLKRHGPDIQVMLRLARICRWSAKGQEEQSILQQAIQADPLDGTLLQELYSLYVDPSQPELPQHILETLRGRVSPDLWAALEIEFLAKTMDFDTLYDRLRSVPVQGARTQPQARFLVQALIGSLRISTGLRYLRLCLREWPDDAHLLNLYVTVGLRLGAYSDVEAQIKRCSEHVSEVALLQHRFVVSAYRGDLETALTHYARLRDLGQVEKSQRNRMVLLLFAILEPNQAADVFARIGDPVAEDPERRARFRHFGQIMTELQLEFRNHDALDVDTDYFAWVRARSGSTVAAIRAINHWTPPPQKKAATPGTIPKQIFQYWNEVTPPKELDPLLKTWRDLPGYSYTLYDRGAALKFLRDEYGAEWVRAFSLAIHPSQESDLLRLCVLAHQGGIYSDVDDALVKNLTGLIRQDDQLVLFREPLGGALGNNFLAARKGHPAIRHAAEMAKDALMSRCNETIWSATGPGLLNRAIAHYLVHSADHDHVPELRIMEWPDIVRHISMHNRLPYKSSQRYWNNKRGAEKQNLWQDLSGALGA